MNLGYYVKGPHIVYNLFGKNESELLAYKQKSPKGFSQEAVPILNLYNSEPYLWGFVSLFVKPAIAILILMIYKKITGPNYDTETKISKALLKAIHLSYTS